MSLPPYVLERLTRHGHAVDRLRAELRDGKGEFNADDEQHAIAFDAADFVWAYLMFNKSNKVQGERWLRNRVAEAILNVLKEAEQVGVLQPSSDR
jgi:hypothetical protein